MALDDKKLKFYEKGSAMIERNTALIKKLYKMLDTIKEEDYRFGFWETDFSAKYSDWLAIRRERINCIEETIYALKEVTDNSKQRLVKMFGTSMPYSDLTTKINDSLVIAKFIEKLQ